MIHTTRNRLGIIGMLLVVVYLVTSFLTLELDIRNWEYNVRVGTLVIFSALCLISVLVWFVRSTGD